MCRLSTGCTSGAASLFLLRRSGGADRRLFMASSSVLPAVRLRYSGSEPSITIHGAQAVLVSRSASSLTR